MIRIMQKRIYTDLKRILFVKKCILKMKAFFMRLSFFTIKKPFFKGVGLIIAIPKKIIYRTVQNL